MPCSDGGWGSGYQDNQLESYRDENAGLRNRNDTLARMLCYVLTKVEEKWPYFIHTSLEDEVSKWWHDHKKFDELRKQRENQPPPELNSIRPFS